MAIWQAGSSQGSKERDALENLGAEYKGLIKTYRKPFTAQQHDALNDGDYIMVVWKAGKIVPLAAK